MLKYPPGQALRHGAPCFRVVGSRPRRTHVIGTKRDCRSCRSYRDHLGVSYARALAIRAEGDQTDLGHKCLACAWGRRFA